ncbi:MAG: 50S ribosomal protein L25 [Deltaproteobacteria bacterium]|nr:50S ribosomal protein L25 [Deltaproteobacteria bacterium]
MEELTIDVKLRTGLGKQRAKDIRNHAEVPGVIYGKHHDTVHVAIPLEGLEKIMKAGNNEIVRVHIKDGGDAGQRLALIKEVQRHIVTDEFLHVDLYEVSENEAIKTKVPVFVVGKAKGIELGGILQIVARELNIKCLPTAIPRHIEIDVSHLNIGHTLHVRDLKPIEGIEFIDSPEAPVVHVMVPAKEEVVQPVVTEVVSAEPEVIKKGKEAKEGEQPAEEAKETAKETKQAAPQAKEKPEPKKEQKKESK